PGLGRVAEHDRPVDHRRWRLGRLTRTLEEEPMTSPGRRIIVLARLLLVLVACLAAFAPSAHADLMIIGNDEKVVFDAEGNRQFVAPGKDTISVVDITDREAPKILLSFPLMNSSFVPPTNIAITSDDRLGMLPIPV